MVTMMMMIAAVELLVLLVLLVPSGRCRALRRMRPMGRVALPLRPAALRVRGFARSL